MSNRHKATKAKALRERVAALARECDPEREAAARAHLERALAALEDAWGLLACPGQRALWD